MKYITKKSDKSIRSLENSAFCHYMQGIPEYKPYIKCTDPRPFSAMYEWKTEYDGEEKCRHGVPRNLQDKNYAYTKQEKPKGKCDIKIKWQEYRHYLSNGALSVKDYRYIANFQLDGVNKIFMINPDGSLNVIQGKMKGTAQYARKLAAQTIGKSEKIMRKRKYLYFLTTTYSPKLSGENRLNAWENYAKSLAPLNRFLREKYGVLFVRALESTKNQYPHAHYFIGTDKEIEMGDYKKINQCIGTETPFWQEIQEYLPAPVFCLEKAESIGAAFYVSKYISKSMNKDLRKMEVPTDKKKRKEWLKEMATIFIPVIAGVRQIEYSRNIDNTPDLPFDVLEKLERVKKTSSDARETPENQFSVKNWVEWYQSKFEFTRAEMSRVRAGFAMLHEVLDDPERARAERAQLDMLLTNSTKTCACDMYLGSGKDAAEIFGDENIENGTLNSEQKKFIVQKCKRIGCKNCPLSRFSQILQGVNIKPMIYETDRVYTFRG